MAKSETADAGDLLAAGEEALSLGNRGPVRFEADGSLAREITDGFSEHGFYVLEGVIGKTEIKALRKEVAYALAHAPVTLGAEVDRDGNPPIGAEFEGPSFSFAKPLSDPLGGTDRLQGRHPVKMLEPAAGDDAPEYTIDLITSILRLMDSSLCLYGNSDLLRIAENILGPDFLPFNENIFIKEPGQGVSVAWHQDGTTHWDDPELDELGHGYNYQVQLWDTTPANALWVVPGTHRHGKADIPALKARARGDLLPGAVPVLCKAGDVSMCNRQTVHGSLANVSPDRRWSITYGFLPRRGVAGITNRKLSGAEDTYTDERLHERSRMIPLSVDARHQRYPQEDVYSYAPFRGEEDDNRWNEDARQRIQNYSRLNVHL